MPTQTVPYFEVRISAGFPSAADDASECPLDLHELLVEHPAATFFIKVEGDSMVGAGIHSGDLLVVDRALEAVDGKIIVALINNEFTVKRLRKNKTRVFLVPENRRYSPFEITEETDFQVWGVVTYVIHSAR